MRYGPHIFETHEAKIKIGALQCEPAEEEEMYDVKIEIKNLEERFNDIVMNVELMNGTGQDLSRRVHQCNSQYF